MLANFFIPWGKKDLDLEIFQSTGGGAWSGPPGAHDLVETKMPEKYIVNQESGSSFAASGRSRCGAAGLYGRACRHAPGWRRRKQGERTSITHGAASTPQPWRGASDTRYSVEDDKKKGM